MDHLRGKRVSSEHIYPIHCRPSFRPDKPLVAAAAEHASGERRFHRPLISGLIDVDYLFPPGEIIVANYRILRLC